MGTAQTWNASYEGSPTDGSSPANGDDEIRNLKTTIKTFNNKEHWHGYEVDDGSNQNLITFQGAHRAGSAMPFIQATAPTAPLIGGSWDYYHDYGRLWIDTGNGGKMMYLYFEDADDVTPEWKPVINYSVGEIAAFAVVPDAADRWTTADGRTVTKSDVSPDGVTGGFSDLIDKLFAETGGDSEHPYYVQADGNAVKLPDARGTVPRGLGNMSAAGSVQGNRVDPDDATKYIDHEITRSVGSYQRDKIYNHDHRLDHSHGGGIHVDGRFLGDGRTGIPSWSAGDSNPGEETGATWEADSEHITTGGVLTMRDPTNESGSVAGSGSADNVNVDVDLEHHHTVPQEIGLTADIEHTNAAADTTYGLPERDYPYAEEGTVKNLGVYWMIRY